MKKCSKCHKIYPATPEYFSRNKSRKDNLACWCKECYKRYKQSDKGKATLKKYRQTEESKQSRRNSDYKYNYGITLAEYDQMFEQQNSCCAICGQPEIVKFKGKIKPLSVDHNHKTGKIRGLLCVRCNLILRDAKDNILTLHYAMEYLKKNKDTL